MPRPRQPHSPFRYFNSSPEVIRLAVLLCVKYPLRAPMLARDQISSLAFTSTSMARSKSSNLPDSGSGKARANNCRRSAGLTFGRRPCSELIREFRMQLEQPFLERVRSACARAMACIKGSKRICLQRVRGSLLLIAYSEFARDRGNLFLT
jgi:hypothetical protein